MISSVKASLTVFLKIASIYEALDMYFSFSKVFVFQLMAL